MSYTSVIPTVNEQVFNPTAELEMSTNEANAETETQPLTTRKRPK